MLFWLIVGKTLSPEDYGIIATSTQLSLFISPLTLLGLGFASNKLIPEFLEGGFKNKIQGIINYSFKIVSLASIVLALILIPFSFQISSYLKLKPEVIWIISFVIALSSMGGILAGFYRGFQNMKKIFLTNLFGHLAKVIFPLILIFLGFGYFGPLIGLVLCYLVILITRLDKKFFTISKKVIVDKKLILTFSIPSFITTIFIVLFNETQYIILTLLESVENTGFFAIAGKITFFIPVIPHILTSALFPIISGLDSDRNKKTKRKYLIKLTFRYTLFIILPTAVFLVLFSEYVILFFSKPEYLPGMTFLPLLTSAGVFLGLGNLFLSSLYAIGKPKIPRNIQIISTLVYLFLAIPLTYYFSGVGLAISYLTATIIIFFLSFIFIRKSLDLSLPFKDIGRIILAIFFSILFLILLKSYIKNFLMAGIFVGIAGLIYFLVLLKLNFYLEEDLKVLDFLSDRSPIFRKEISKLRNYLSNFIERSYK